MNDWIIEKIAGLTETKKIISIADFAEKKRIMPKGTPFPGPVDNSRTPYNIEFMDDLDETSDVEVTVYMKSVQIGVTHSIENAVLKWVDLTPAPILYSTATLELGKEWSEKRFDQMITQSGLQHKIFSQSEKKTNRKSGDTTFLKEFPGGFIKIVGYGSADALRSSSCRFYIGDEIDAATGDLKNEGSALELAEGRTVAYARNRKIALFSSPKEKEKSRIYAAYLIGDQRKYFVPCPHCGHMQVLDFFKGIQYETDEDGVLIESSVGYKCVYCDKIFKNHHKSEMLKNGEWRATAKPKQHRYRSRHINSLYAPVGSINWPTIVQKYISAIDSPDGELLKTFYNLYLGLPSEETGDAPTYQVVASHRSNYLSRSIPDPVLYLTLSGDVQGDRIELEICGHARGYRTYSIEYLVIEGDTSNANEGAWAKFREMFYDGYFIYSNHKGKFAPQMCLIDSNYRTNVVIEFCETCPGIYPSVGVEKFRARYKRFEIKDMTTSSLMHVTIATSAYKDLVYSSLRVEMPPSGEVPPNYPSFPADYPDNYFKMLNAEYKRKKRVKGVTSYEWHCPNGRRNEALDLRVYNLCCSAVLYHLSIKNVLDEHIVSFEKERGRKCTVGEKMEFFYKHMEDNGVLDV